jgi:TrmH family RNA methyltransferase
MGAVFTQASHRRAWDEFIAWLRARNGQLVAASLRDAIDYRSAPYQRAVLPDGRQRIARTAGQYEDACDLRVTMPMLGRADSLNAAVAGAVLAYEALALYCGGTAAFRAYNPPRPAQ